MNKTQNISKIKTFLFCLYEAKPQIEKGMKD